MSSWYTPPPPVTSNSGGGGGGSVISVTNDDSSLNVSPNTGDVIVELNTTHSNIWPATQTFTTIYAKVPVSANTSNIESPDTPATSTSRTIFFNNSLASQNALQLPGAVAGLEFSYFVLNTPGVHILAPVGGVIRMGTVVSTTGGYIDSTGVGSAVRLVAVNSTIWAAMSIVGNWSVG